MRLVVISCFLTFALPSTTIAQSPETITTIVNLDTGNISVSGHAGNPAAASTLALTTDFTVRTSVITSPLGRATNQMNLRYLCTNGSGAFLDCTVGLSHQVVGFSGGHDHHDDDRPKGTLSRTTGSTQGSSGFLTVFTAPEVSGVISLQVTHVFPPPDKAAMVRLSTSYKQSASRYRIYWRCRPATTSRRVPSRGSTPLTTTAQRQ